MPSGAFVTPLDVAAQVDRLLRRNIQWPLRNLVFADSPVTLTDLDRSAMCNAAGGAMVVNLPDATLNKGMFFEVKKTDASGNTVTIQSSVGGQTIDGAGVQVLVSENDFIVVESDGSNYKIVAKVISTPGGGGAVFYTAKKIYKTDGVTTLVPVDGTLIPFTVAVDGECFFAATGIFAGFTGLASVDLAIYVDGVLLVHSPTFFINGSGGDSSGPVTQEPCGSKFLTAGPHTVELVAGQVNLSLQASVADPLTLSVLYPAASFNTAAPTPKAATLVVHPVPGVGDFTTIEAALAAIVALGGGYILVREGTYTVPVGGYIMPDVPVVIRGCGRGVTILDQGANADATFVVGFVHDYVIEDLTVTGGVADVDRRMVSASVAADVSVLRVDGTFLRTVIEVTGGAAAAFHVDDSSFDLFNNAASWFVLAGITAAIHASDVTVTATGNSGGISGAPHVELSECTLTAVNGFSVGSDSVLVGCALLGAAGESVSLAAKSKVTSCRFDSLIVTVAGDSVLITNCAFNGSAGQARDLVVSAPSIGPLIVNCIFRGCTTDLIQVNAGALDTIITGCHFFDDATAARAIDVLAGAFRCLIDGNGFEFFATEAIQIATANCIVTSNTGCKVVETVTANINRYANNTGFDPSTIVGPASLIEDEQVLGPVSVDIVLDEFMRTVTVDASGAARTVTLPSALSARWRKYIVKKVDASANTVTVTAAGGDNIDGAGVKVLAAQYDFVEIQSDGVNTWWIV